MYESDLPDDVARPGAPDLFVFLPGSSCCVLILASAILTWIRTKYERASLIEKSAATALIPREIVPFMTITVSDPETVIDPEYTDKYTTYLVTVNVSSIHT